MLEDLRPKTEKNIRHSRAASLFFQEVFWGIHIYICVHRFIYIHIFFLFVYTSFKCWIPKLFTNNIKHIMFFPQQFKPEGGLSYTEWALRLHWKYWVLAGRHRSGRNRRVATQICFMFTPIWEDFQFDYIIFFRWVETTNQWNRSL